MQPDFFYRPTLSPLILPAFQLAKDHWIMKSARSMNERPYFSVFLMCRQHAEAQPVAAIRSLGQNQYTRNDVL